MGGCIPGSSAKMSSTYIIQTLSDALSLMSSAADF